MGSNTYYYDAKESDRNWINIEVESGMLEIRIVDPDETATIIIPLSEIDKIIEALQTIKKVSQ